jgi:uncharacterized protein (TIGR02757 family)
VIRKPPRLGQRLEELASRFGARYVDTDPIRFPHRYGEPQDQEAAAFIASVLAYGSVPQIVRSVERALAALGGPAGPAAALDAGRERSDLARLRGFRHRFNDARDVACLYSFLRQIRRRAGSIAGFFEEGAPRGAPIRERLSAFSRRALALDPGTIYGGDLPASAGVRFFFPDPLDGSACKRLCMFLRWVVRPADGVDLGLWRGVDPGELVMPLDTHTTRICYWNGLSPSPFATWRNAERVTQELRRYDARDPVRFDFALSRLGILRVRLRGRGRL